jgi:hypothetical protein
MSDHKHATQKGESNGTDKGHAVSKLGQRLRELSDKAIASGTTTLTIEQIHRRVSDVRGELV